MHYSERSEEKMAKRISSIIKLHIPGGQANPSPPVGPALGQHGLNIMEFCKAFNETTKDKQGLIIPVVISVYEDKSFSFITKAPPVAVLLKKAVGIAKASGEPNKEKIGSVSRKQLEEIARTKLKDFNTEAIDKAMKTVEGTARSMGIEISES